jgi:hypothetical protein
MTDKCTKTLTIQSHLIRPFTDIDLLSDSNQRALFEYWLKFCNVPDIPSPDRIDALAFPRRALPFLVVEEFEPDTRRFRTRLAGTAYRDAVGYESTNRRTDETPGAAEASARLAWTVEARQPYWYQGPFTFSARPWTTFSVLGLPFAHPGEPVSRVLCVFDLDPA